MRESSPVFGGALVGAAIVLALMYSLGDSGTLSDVVMVLTDRFGDMLISAGHAVQQIFASATG